MTKKLHRFIGPYQLGQGTMRLDNAELEHQMRSVLKLEPGETVIIGDGTGLEAQCRLLGYEKGAVLLQGLSVGRNPNELALRATLYCAVLKADHFELAAQKATEVGIAEIVPIVTTRPSLSALGPCAARGPGGRRVGRPRHSAAGARRDGVVRGADRGQPQ
jgi:16S rRNA (uracil1498-N3)-methyltransferase